MAKMIDIKPSYYGEAKLWECLKEYLPNDIIVYNNREINGREFDFCLFIEGVGALIIEVKGWIANKIDVQGIDQILVEGYDSPQHSPKKQARAYRFALLNKIVAKYNVSPLVFDMVCYPFISKEEYQSKHLDIVSEEQFTIFKEDLEDADSLTEKIRKSYDSVKNIPHAEFNSELMVRLRQEWEPDFVRFVKNEEVLAKPYSILSVKPFVLNDQYMNSICSDYFKGVKRVVFLGDYNSYKSLISKLNNEFKNKNIQPNSNNLGIGYVQGLSQDRDVTRTFNLEIYHVDSLATLTNEDFDLIEGIIEEKKDIIEKLSEITTFNYQQFLIEHSDSNLNTLVEAGAGTGKTYSMVSRIAYLCNKKIGAISNIADELAMVTFTNDAAINMKTRLKQMFLNYYVLTGKPDYLKHIEDIERTHISTIHSFALDILRKHPLYTGLGTNFKIVSNELLRSQFYDVHLNDFLKRMEDSNENFINEIPVSIYDLKKKMMELADKLLNKSIDLKTIKKSEMGLPVENSLPYFNDMIEEIIIPSEIDYSNFLRSTNCIDLKEALIILHEILLKMEGKINFLKIKHLFGTI